MGAVVRRDWGVRVWVDGQEGPVYDRIEGLQFSPGGEHVAYAASSEGWKWRLVLDGVEWREYGGIGNITFSDDGKRLAYVAEKGRRQVVVVDGREGREYDGIREGLVFSPDGQHLAYVALRGRERVVVVDDEEGAPYDDIGWFAPVFSGDGNHIAYDARREGKWLVARDGQEGPPYDEIVSLTLSHDGQRMLYTAQQGHRQLAVADGQEGPRYDIISDLILFANESRTAYTALQGTGWRVVVDGLPGRSYTAAWIAGCCAWTDHITYAAKGSGKWSVYATDLETPRYDEIGRDSLLTDWDGKPTAYVARRGSKWFTVVGGEKGPEYDLIWCTTDWRYAARYAVYGERAARVVETGGRAVLSQQSLELAEYHGERYRWHRRSEWDVTAMGPPVVSLEGKRFGYEAKKGDKWVLVLDGQEGPEYDSIGYRTLRFSPDEQHFAYVAARAGREMVVLDGREGPEYDRISENGPSFLSDGTLAFMAWRDQEVYRVTVPPTSPRAEVDCATPGLGI